MIEIPVSYLLTINGAMVIISAIIGILLGRLGYKYVLLIGDSDKQGRLKKVILWLIMLLLFISLAAAVFNLFSEPI